MYIRVICATVSLLNVYCSILVSCETLLLFFLCVLKKYYGFMGFGSKNYE